jgi:hypothetical protein
MYVILERVVSFRLIGFSGWYFDEGIVRYNAAPYRLNDLVV